MNAIAKLKGAALVFTLFSYPAVALELPPEAGIFLIDRDNNKTRIGNVSFSAGTSGHSGFSVTMAENPFTEHFLSMRPFRCIEGDIEWYCYLPYPYGLRGTVSADDLTDLEYSLLFIRKTPAEFGIDAWNGLYFKLSQEEPGKLTGELLEGDLNVLASPPDEEFARPINLDEFVEAETSKRLFPHLVIE